MTGKLLALILSFSMVFAFAPAQAQINEVTKTHDVLAAVEFLDAVGIIDAKEYDGTKNITRGEFVSLVYSMLGFSESEDAYEGNVHFSDVGADHEYAWQIYTVKDMNLISGFSDGTFRPDATISGTEAMVVLTRLLGYGYRAEAKGGYPGGYHSVFNSLELSDGLAINYTAPVKWSEAVVMMRGALEESLDVQTYGSDGITGTKVEKGTTLLNSNLGIDTAEGVVEGVDITNLRGDNTTPPRRIRVEGTEIYVGKDDVYGYLGYAVKAYYKSADHAKGRRLVYIEKDSINNEYILDTKDIISVSDGVVTAYSENGKKTNYRYEPYGAIIYNGVTTGYAFNKNLLSGENGRVLLIDNDGNRTADVVVIDIYENYVAGRINKDDYIVYDYYETGKYVALDLEKDEPYVLLYDKNGKEIPFGRIGDMSVVSVAKSLTDAPQTFIRAYVSDDKITGTLEAMSESSAGCILTVGGKEVELTATCLKYAKDEITIGSEVEIGLDIYGYGSYIEPATSDKEQFGYIMAMDTEKGLSGETYVKFMDDKGNFGITTFADNLTIDDKVYKKDYDAVKAVLNKSCEAIFGNEVEAGCIAQAMRYSVNAEGRIDFIDTVFNSYDGTLGAPGNMTGKNTLYMLSYDNLNYKQNALSLGGQILVSNDTKVFRVPMPNDSATNYLDEDFYAISKRTYFQDNNNYTGIAYYSRDDAASAQLITIKNSAGGGGWGSTEIPFAYFVKASKSFDENEEVVTKIYYWQYGKLQTMNCREDNISFTVKGETFRIEDLKCGDMFRYSVDGKGNLDAFVLVYRAETDTLYPVYPTGVYDTPRMVKGYVYGAYDDGFRFEVTDDVYDLEDGIGLETARNIGTVMIYDKDGVNESEKLKPATHSQLVGYDRAGADCSKIVLQERYCAPVGIYIIK